VFLDRDGTINVGPARGAYLARPADVELIDDAASAIRRLNAAGIWVGIVTNQRGIALGLMTLDELAIVHQRLFSKLAMRGAKVDATYACPHEIGVCDCRKPLPGLLLRAQREVGGLDFAQAAMIGDSRSDIAAGKAVGATVILLGRTNGDEGGADYQAVSLTAALDWLSVPNPPSATPTRSTTGGPPPDDP
jgi:D-glycero-D-manno-heptose 1,7-bisphosphate phosphatase